MIIPTLPEDIRSILVAKLSLLWPEEFKDIDSEFLGVEHLFECLHFSIYNRFSVDVSDSLIYSIKINLNIVTGTFSA
jgi:hypothetical protein